MQLGKPAEGRQHFAPLKSAFLPPNSFQWNKTMMRISLSLHRLVQLSAWLGEPAERWQHKAPSESRFSASKVASDRVKPFCRLAQISGLQSKPEKGLGSVAAAWQDRTAPFRPMNLFSVDLLNMPVVLGARNGVDLGRLKHPFGKKVRFKFWEEISFSQEWLKILYRFF